VEPTIDTVDALRREAENLTVALISRDIIGQAKGLLMCAEGLDGDEAFARLVTMSQHQNVKLSAVAARLVAAHEQGRPVTATAACQDA
jgi:AmiR/NasT family two-component response regulator